MLSSIADEAGMLGLTVLRGLAMPLADWSERGFRAAGDVRYEISCRHLNSTRDQREQWKGIRCEGGGKETNCLR